MTSVDRPTPSPSPVGWTARRPSGKRSGKVPVEAKGDPAIDRITLTGLTATGFHGVFPQERREGQPFVVDVELELTVDTVSDQLANTVNYAEIAADVEAVVTSEPRNLIETVAGEIADRCLSHGRVDRVTVTVHKPKAPINQTFTDVSVTISRSRHV
ncbi:dihydroneopterin aldolase [Tessaracoccus sp. ZS01]|nr:dihydroneopterin aldolase [Tessaracoccus sp. ZS01]